MKTLKKLAFVLAVLLALGCVAPMAAMAEDTNTTIGYSKANVVTIDTTGYTDINDESVTLDTVQANGASGKYTINNEEGLMKLASLVNQAGTGNTFFAEGAIFVQTKDLNLEDYDWVPIGTYVGESSTTSTAFWSTYDGQGYTISNMKFKYTNPLTQATAVGLFFSYGRRSTTIRNVVLDETCEVSYTGKPADTTRTSVGVPMGSIIGMVDASSFTISNCYSAAKVTNTDGNANSGTGGIVGAIKNTSGTSSVLEKCTFAGSATSVVRVGGIVGYVMNCTLTIQNCCNIGAVKTTASSTNDTYVAGGIVGAPNNKNNECIIQNCANYGTVSSNGAPNVGGIIGLVRKGVTATNNTDYGTVVIADEGQTMSKIYGQMYSDDGDDAALGVDATNAVAPDADRAMFHGYQIRENGENAVDLRLVASIDGKTYSAVGMKVTVTFTYNSSSVTKVLDTEAGSKTTTVYSTLTTYANDENVDYTASALRVDEKEGYLYAVVLTGIPKAAFAANDFTVTVTPYALDLNNAETEYTGVQAVKGITLDTLPDNTVNGN